jgi:cold-inducible RNA-binding protein
MQKLSADQRETWGDNTQVKQLFVGGLPEKTCELALSDYFSTFGYLTECRIVRDQVTHQSRGFAFVTFSSPEATEKVLSWKKHVFLKKEISVKAAETKVETQKQSPPNKERRSKKALHTVWGDRIDRTIYTQGLWLRSFQTETLSHYCS